MKSTDYVSGLHYENDTLRFLQHAEGRVCFGTAGGYLGNCANQAFITLLIVFLSICVGCKRPAYEDILPQLLGIEVKVKDRQVFEEVGGIAEGYRMEIYVLSGITVNSFLSLPLKDIPNRLAGERVWLKYGWRETPLDSLYGEVMGMAINYYSGNNQIESHLAHIRSGIKEHGVYYALYYAPDRENPKQSIVFILDTQSNKFYCIESNY